MKIYIKREDNKQEEKRYNDKDYYTNIRKKDIYSYFDKLRREIYCINPEDTVTLYTLKLKIKRTCKNKDVMGRYIDKKHQINLYLKNIYESEEYFLPYVENSIIFTLAHEIFHSIQCINHEKYDNDEEYHEIIENDANTQAYYLLKNSIVLPISESFLADIKDTYTIHDNNIFNTSIRNNLSKFYSYHIKQLYGNNSDMFDDNTMNNYETICLINCITNDKFILKCNGTLNRDYRYFMDNIYTRNAHCIKSYTNEIFGELYILIKDKIKIKAEKSKYNFYISNKKENNLNEYF